MRKVDLEREVIVLLLDFDSLEQLGQSLIVLLVQHAQSQHALSEPLNVHCILFAAQSGVEIGKYFIICLSEFKAQTFTLLQQGRVPSRLLLPFFILQGRHHLAHVLHGSNHECTLAATKHLTERLVCPQRFSPAV